MPLPEGSAVTASARWVGSKSKSGMSARKDLCDGVRARSVGRVVDGDEFYQQIFDELERDLVGPVGNGVGGI